MIKTIKTIAELRELRYSAALREKKIGFVPTMGYLHRGHLSLVERAKQECDEVFVSIYVNPTQFGANEDFKVYPRDLQRDIELLTPYTPLYLFTPDSQEMYFKDHSSWISVSGMSEKLCGKRREGHFRGVATVVAKFLNIISPDMMFMGEKDFQQIVILEKMISDLNFPVDLVRCPTVREDDGLAMSSRNKYLSATERENAASIYQAILIARDLYRSNVRDSKTVVKEMRRHLEKQGGVIDYIEIVSSSSLKSLEQLEERCRVVLAVNFGKTRLIDNADISVVPSDEEYAAPRAVIDKIYGCED